MSQIEELQRRIMAAMDKVAQGLDGLGPASGGDVADLQSALDDEKVVSAQLTERVLSLKKRHEKELEEQAAHTEETQSNLTKLDLDLQRLRKANAELSQACQALTEANATGVAEAHLINTAMQAELEALRAARAADASEADVILSSLTPLLEAADATPTQEKT